MASIHVDVDDYLDGASDDALKTEVLRRIKAGEWKEFDATAMNDDPNGTHAWTRRGMADDIRQAYYARNTNRLEVILAQLELREMA